MRAISRVGVLVVLATIITSGSVQAAAIDVAEFRWDLLTTPGVDCPPEDLVCIPEDPLTQSIFTLTNIWAGVDPAVTLFDNRLVLSTATLDFPDLEVSLLLNAAQIGVLGIPDRAASSVSFIFAGQVVSLGTTLTAPDTFAVLQFDPTAVPEPGTLGLVALGVTLLLGRTRHTAARRPRA
jgi:hypothetical protein